MACAACTDATIEWSGASPLPRSTVITEMMRYGILAFLVGVLWKIAWWNIRFGTPMKVLLITGAAFLITWLFLWKAIPAWRRYWHRNVIARYQWYWVDPADGRIHEHQEPARVGVEFRLPYSGWRAAPAVARDGRVTPCWDIKVDRAEYVLSNLDLNGERWGSVRHHEPTFLIKVVESGMLFPQLLKLLFCTSNELSEIEAQLGRAGHTPQDIDRLLTREEGFCSLYAFVTALREVIQSPDYARSPYAKFVGDILKHSWPFPTTGLKDDPRFERVLESWRTELRSQAEDVLPKRKAMQPAS